MAYVTTETPFVQEGEFTGGDGVTRSIVNLGCPKIDEGDARRLAIHYKERKEQGLEPLAAECRELAAPLMQAMVDAGLADAG
ncbi:MAG: hypothetical protein ACO3O1_06440 [Ilumatobacteraceae bacterium]|jgi:hypothetical protein